MDEASLVMWSAGYAHTLTPQPISTMTRQEGSIRRGPKYCGYVLEAVE